MFLGCGAQWGWDGAGGDATARAVRNGVGGARTVRARRVAVPVTLTRRAAVA